MFYYLGAPFQQVALPNDAPEALYACSGGANFPQPCRGKLVFALTNFEGVIKQLTNRLLRFKGHSAW